MDTVPVCSGVEYDGPIEYTCPKKPSYQKSGNRGFEAGTCLLNY